MVDCCANPGCRADFRLLNSGALHALERRSADTEFFWLCSECTSQFNLQLDPDGGLSLRPLGERWQAHPANREGRLRLVSRAVHRVPWRQSVPAGEHPLEDNPGEWGGLARLPRA